MMEEMDKLNEQALPEGDKETPAQKQNNKVILIILAAVLVVGLVIALLIPKPEVIYDMKDDPVVGNWTLSKVDVSDSLIGYVVDTGTMIKSLKDMGVKPEYLLCISCNADGTVESIELGEKYTGTWSRTKDGLYTTYYEDEEIRTFKMDGDKIIETEPDTGIKYTYVRSELTVEEVAKDYEAIFGENGLWDVVSVATGIDLSAETPANNTADNTKTEESDSIWTVLSDILEAIGSTSK